MIKVSEKTITLEEFLKQPETKPAREYINGQIIQKPMRQGKHSKLQGELVTVINQFVKNSKVAMAFPELRCTFDGSSVVPDVTVFAWERIPVEESGDIANVFPLPPDWMIEILSPDQSSTKVTGIILNGLNHGTKMGWLIDPKARSILVFPQEQQPKLLAKPEEILPVPNLVGDLHLTVGDVFSWLKL